MTFIFALTRECWFWNCALCTNTHR